MIDLADFQSDFTDRFGYQPAIFSAPGRVNLIGEHTDYNDGFVLPFAIDKRTYVGISPRTDGVIHVHSRTIDKSESFSPGDSKRTEGWSLYVRGMAEVLRARGYGIQGADLLIDSSIPFGAGLSSSAALEISVGLALASASDQPVDLVDLALIGQEVEHRYLGVRSGIMDQFTSALGREGHALFIDCRSHAYEHIPLHLDDFSLVVCDSKVKHELASSEYNVRRAECEEGVKLLQGKDSAVKALRDVSESELESLEDILPETIRRRCRHVITENARTAESAKAIRDGNMLVFGDLMYRSHRSLRDDYEVSCDELDLLVEAASKVDGVLGARMTGGGFGGCTINLLRKDKVPEFISQVSSLYRTSFGRETEIFTVVPSDGAKALSGHDLSSVPG
jgi:galactokinase